MADKLNRSDQELEDMLAEVNAPKRAASKAKTNSQVWHVKGESEKGCFQWLVEEDGTIIDCPYHLRGYWVGRHVDMDRLLDGVPPAIFVRCKLSDHLDEVRTTSLQVKQSHETSLPDYAYDTPYTGGLYDLSSR